MPLVLRLGFVVVMLSLAGSARAEFFDDVRRTFQTDIPHFFQDDIPCAFGGQPTSGARRSCKGAESPPAHPTAARKPNPPTARPRHEARGPAAQATTDAPAKPEVETRTPREYP